MSLMSPRFVCSALTLKERGLLTYTKFFLGDDGAVAVDVFLDKVVKKAAALTYESLQCAFCAMIFVI